jgi:cation:H+ antiporter
MPILLDSLKLLLLFIALGWSANFAVKNIKYLGAVLKIRLFAFGILLGIITSLPELFLGINATIDRATALSVGNLLGGIIVMLGLILGASLILNRKITTDGRASLIPTVLVIFSLILFGIDGKYSLFDGIAMIGLYVGLIFYLYRLNHFSNHKHIEITDSNRVGKSIVLAIVGIIGVLISSHWIVGITLDLLNYIQVSQLVIGLVVFSIGTNLPEISIAITSWRKKLSEISLSHLLSSSFTNVLVLGVLALLRPIIFDTNSAFWIVAIFLGVILTLFAYFYHSGKKMDRREGIILLAVYVIFIVVNICFGLLGK